MLDGKGGNAYVRDIFYRGHVTHFWHTNIISYENRPFKDAEEMNAHMIKAWNDTVGKHDKVYHLGDFAFGTKEVMAEIAKQLKGRKMLIYGNHDHRSPDYFRSIGFQEVSKYPIIIHKKYILSHAPLQMSVHSQFTNIHGHIHDKTMGTLKHINVGVERTHYRPVLLEELGEIR